VTKSEQDLYVNQQKAISNQLKRVFWAFAWRACIAALTTQLVACLGVVGTPIGPGMDPVPIEERAQRIDVSGKTRDEVIAEIGKPWISDERYRVDVFRVSSTQYNIIFVLPFPLPFPDVPTDFHGYSLVSYAPNGRVEAADWAYDVDPFGTARDVEREHRKFTARAGDFVLEHPKPLLGGVKELALGVTHARFLRELHADAHSSASCTLLTVCGVFLPNLGWSVNRDVCFNRLHLDNRDVGEAVVANQYSMPIRVAPGTHHLSFTSEDFTGAAETTLNCAAGEVWYAKFRSELTQKYSSMESLSRGWKIGEVAAQVTLTREPSAGDVPAAVLLYYDGKEVYRGEIDSR